ncbi:TIGR01458 family HAD-type hydrolase [Methylobacterium gnaphalii]|uniref:Phospholysine phosphohistidine inorganic pyrophosphate phosphatase n=1 Tax=Methylobacterium gnaphalii TaxID=1010610 RepID=A0A512JQJ2_9HYPH|nr:TIGR01458 family HAD-type hydrolase [Methylobacterium gnaphalii]GEP12237.1 hydrolase [Methylobacterium gnaphalii]GJD70557.1 Acid sugar phosphatase [Methylobacterium gnaphalii]GLS48524.1 hydrolase [Methylobacterium gnaphalii]
MTKVTGVLLDLSGVVFSGDEAIIGAVEAINDLRSHGIPLCFVTNTTSMPVRGLLEKLHLLGIAASRKDIFTPAVAARRLVMQHGLSPHLLVHPNLLEDFDELSADRPNALIIGDAGSGFSYHALNDAFRIIDAGAEFIALACNRTFRDTDGELSLDAGPFVKALEFATRREALVLGKPAPSFYAEAVAHLGTANPETVMIGDDVESDVAGALHAGLQGLLVRTGKYRSGDEGLIDRPPTAVLADLREAVNWILDKS